MTLRRGLPTPRPRPVRKRTPPTTADELAGGGRAAPLQHLQQVAGNRAVTALLAASVQRSPGTDTKDRSPAAFAETVVPAPAGTQADPGPGAVTRPPGLTAGAVPVAELEILGAFTLDPSRVIRSPSASWHAQMYRLDGGQGAVPMAFRVGDQIAVHPDYDQPATPLPNYSAGSTPPPTLADAVPASGSAAGSSAGTAAGQRPGAATVGTEPPAPPGGRRVVARPPGWDTARPAALDEVAAVYQQDPSRVMRSPSDYWHEQMYHLDEGAEHDADGAPQVFRVGGQYLVAPGYQGPATPLDPAAEQQRVRALTAGVSLPDVLVDQQGRLGGTTMTMSSDAGRTEVVSDTRRPGQHTHTSEVTDGGVTHTTTTSGGARFGSDGALAGAGSGRTETTSWAEGGESATRTSATHWTAGASTKGATVGATSSQETAVVDAAGNTVRTGSSTTGSAYLGPSGYGASGSHSSTSATGTTSSASGELSGDFKGNYDASAGVGITGSSGLGASAKLGTGHHVTAEEPAEVSPGVWEVRYVVDDSSTQGVGGSASHSGVGLGVSGGRSESTLQTGSRRFSSEQAALAFVKDPNAVLAPERFDLTRLPVTTADGALQIPVGEARGVGDSDTLTGGASASFEGATLGRSGHTSSGHELSVRRVGPNTVQVTTAVTAGAGSDWTASGLGLTNDSGSSSAHRYEVTYEFELGDEHGRREFEAFCQVKLPPPDARRVSVHSLDSQEDHDTYKLGGGTDTWGGKTWQDRTSTDAGTTAKFGGAQTHDATPGRIEKWLGDDETHANAQIVRVDQGGKEAAATAELDVSGESGAANRAEFEKIFGSAGTTGDATASGRWTLTARVPMAAIRELEQVSPRLRAAPTLEEKMRVYSELVKENGAAMLGGQVGLTSRSWNLELKGDPNFPGAAGRERLDTLVKQLRADLKARPASCFAVVHQTDDELAALRKRRAAVADPQRYTDLPARLRAEQLSVIDRHVADFAAVRRNAQALSVRASDRQAAVPDRGYDTLRDKVAADEAAIGSLRKQVHDDSRALGDAIGSRGTAALRYGVDRDEAEAAVALAKALIARASDADRAQAALDPRIDAARDAWTAATEPVERKRTMQQLADLLGERVKRMRDCVDFIHQAAQAIGPVTTAAAMSGNPQFWTSLGVEVPGA